MMALEMATAALSALDMRSGSGIFLYFLPFLVPSSSLNASCCDVKLSVHIRAHDRWLQRLLGHEFL
jgi:hypothetical protein